MERTKVVLLIGLALIVMLPIVCWLDKPSKKTDSVELTEQGKEEQEKKERAKKEKEQESEKRQANFTLRQNLKKKIESVLNAEWYSSNVEEDGLIKVWQENDSYSFHVTGVTATNRNGEIILTGAISHVTNFTEATAVNNTVISRNPSLPMLLEKFKTAVLEME
jgi:hypothetical protein